MKVSLWFYPNEQKKAQKTGVIPIYVRIRLNSKKAEGRLYHAELNEKEVMLWDERTMRLTNPKHIVNKLINAVQKEFDDFAILNSRSLSNFSANAIRDLLLGRGKSGEPTVINYAEDYYTSSIEKSSILSKGTKKNYVKANKHLKNFLLANKMEDLLVKELTSALATKFKDYLLCTNANANRTGMTEPSALGNIKKFRTIFDRAIDEGLLDRNPFKTIKLKNRSPKKPNLSITQVQALQALNLDKYPRLEAYRDLFLFSCFTGLAYEDAHNLTYTNLVAIQGGNTKLYISREKTDILTEVVLVSKTKAIVEKYRAEPENQITKRVLPQRSNQKINDNLKILSNLLKLPFEIKTHIARHTFRQLMGEAGITDMGVIKRMMGQKRGGDIDEVYYSVTESRLLEAKVKFESYLNQHLGQ